jgi:peptidoglycan/LPS O-acetylase OafA/YrhL
MIVLYHFDVHWLSGGYIGVDIFFVISGFLITSHIQIALQQNNFNFWKFYDRRARRLLPALLATLIGCFVAGYFIFPATHYSQQGLASLWALFSVANIGFWLDSGYFSTDVYLKPLLHTWSLSVEEQFYLLWPALLIALSIRRIALTAIIGLALVSLLLSEYWMSKDASTVFFLTPFRVFEFCIGGIIYWLGLPERRHPSHDYLCMLGFAFILLPVLLYNNNFHFPGVAALLPCIGAALLIFGGTHSTIGQLLKNRALRYLGLISYSLYLVHWPLVVYYKYFKLPELRLREQISLLVVALILASLSYHLIERPFRINGKTRGVRPRYFYPGIAIVILGISAVSWNIYKNGGWSWRYDSQIFTQQQVAEGMNRRYKVINRLCSERGREHCYEPSFDKQKNVLVLGDSHATDGVNIFYYAFPGYHYVMKSLPGGCPPIAPADFHIISPRMPEREKCVEFNKSLFDAELLKDYDTIIISAFFQWYRAEHLYNTVKELRKNSAATIIVLGNFISLKRNMSDLHNEGINPIQQPEWIDSFALDEDALKSGAAGQYIFISKRDLLCDGDELNSCHLFFESEPFAYDAHHLNLGATRYAAQQLQKKFKSIDQLK